MATGWKKQYFRYKDFFLNISLLYKKREVRIFLEMFLSLATITILSVFALKPTLETIVQLLKDIKIKEGTVSQLDQKISDLNTAQKVYNDATDSIAAIKYAVPDSANADSLVMQIELLAAQNSVKVLNFMVDSVTLIGKPQAPASDSDNTLTFPPNSAAVSFSITVTGDYSALSTFEAQLENLRRPIVIDSAKIFTVSTDGSNPANSQNLSISGRSPILINN